MKKSALYQKSGGRPGSGSPVKLWGTVVKEVVKKGIKYAGAAYKGKKTKNFPYPWDLRFNMKKGLYQAEGTPKRKNFTD